MDFATAPTTPRKRIKEDGDIEVDMLIENLNMRWDLHLEPQRPNGSSSTRAMTNRTKEQWCVYMITALNFKKLAAQPLAKFQEKAHDAYIVWVKKPNADRGVIPEASRERPHPLSSTERAQMLQYLHDILRESYDEFCAHNKGSKSPWRSRKDERSRSPYVDDSPVPYVLPRFAQDPKRPREDILDEPQTRPKKFKIPDTFAPLTTEAISAPNIVEPTLPGFKGWRSANTSFESNAPSIFSHPGRSFGNSMLGMGASTQDSAPDLENPHASSDYGARSSFEAALLKKAMVIDTLEISSSGIDEGLSQELKNVEFGDPVSDPPTTEDILEERLEDVFRMLLTATNSSRINANQKLQPSFRRP